MIVQVERNLQDFFTEQREPIAAIGTPVSRAVEMLESYVLGGGKRIRPLFTWAGYLATNPSGEHDEAVLRAASSLEFIQACALIHDDIIDSSDTRRGQPTVHRVAESVHTNAKWTGVSSHFGVSVAILIGDLAMVWADDMLHNSGIDSAALQRVLPAWQRMRTEVIGGQLLDITNEASGNEDPVLAHTVNRFKTAAYTIERPLHIGAALGGGDATLIQQLRNFGTDIGLAFQLRDDQLGVFGDPAITGKPAGDDLREGKRTVLLATALSLADAHTASVIRERVGNVSVSNEIAELTELIRKTGAEDAMEAKIQELTTSGLRQLEAMKIPEHARELLNYLAHRATKRKY
ncbi:polyprenyl synthetase family protein [Corynebacterium sp. HS2168-gen11]|nr:polyprenyl synthetase family protein [Corynebacterium sp. HS2168-gen11]MCS4536181.1 polyprenyl synthetase family protein [Corynebacterium sp. HS2168-gen11]